MSRINRPPMSVAGLSRLMKKPGREGKVAVIVGTVTDDKRIFEVPKLTVSALITIYEQVYMTFESYFASDYMQDLNGTK